MMDSIWLILIYFPERFKAFYLPIQSIPMTIPMATGLSKPQEFMIRRFTPEDAEAWDAFVAASPMGTWMQTRRFLSYHGERFQDRSLILLNTKKQWQGILPAAVDPGEPKRVVSHPGLSYGGLIHQGDLQGEKMLCAFQEMAAYYQLAGFQTLRYKAIPSFYHQRPSQDDLYALFRLNANRYRCDITSLIDLNHRPQAGYALKRALQQAQKNQIEVSETECLSDIESLWLILEDNLKRKHGARPVHTVQEIVRLKALFPEAIRFIVGRKGTEIVAGFVLFIMPMTTHMQYSAASEVGYETYALNPIAEYAIALAATLGCRYFDFGISTENDGRVLNQGLYRFKGKFGSGSALHEFFDVTL
jgi:hypothetical protein